MCINADPNYGFIWLQCKHNALEGPKRVLANARAMLLGQDAPPAPAPQIRVLNATSSPFSRNQTRLVWHPVQRGKAAGKPSPQRPANGQNPLSVGLTCLNPLSQCASQGERWRIIFGGDPIKP